MIALICMAMLVACAFPALAKSPDTPTYYNYSWHNLSTAVKTTAEKEVFVITTKAGEHDVQLYITFLEVGGYRIRLGNDADSSGYFDIPGTAIKYENTADGGLRMRGADNSSLVYTKTADGFSLQLYNTKDYPIVTLSNEQISLAYKNGKEEIIKMMVELPLMENEAVYNGAERYTGVDLVGSEVNLYNVDAAYHGASSSVTERPDAYINSPFFHSNRGYSLWFNMAYGGTADIGKTNEHKVSVMFEGGDKLDFVLWSGTSKENIQKYTSITGTSIVPEKWAFSYWMGGAYSPWNYQYTGNGYQNLKNIIDGYAEIGITDIAAYFCEGLFENAQCNQLLRSNNSRMLMWFGAYEYPKSMVQGWLPTVDYIDLPFAHNVKAVNQLSTSNFLDFSNPNIVDMFKSQLTQYWKLGVQGAMIDFGEYLPYDTVCYNGLTGVEMHNLISVDYARASAEAWSSYWGNDYILFQRSGFSGSQKYTANFLGDQTGDWRGLQDQVYATISMGMGGFNIYGGDIGGHVGVTENETYIRWYQFGAFSPLMRVHAAQELRVPWEKGAVATENFKDFYWLRENLVDAIYSSAIEANKTANPMVQGMAVAYPYQRSLASVNDQYVFCNNFLVNPVTQGDAFTRSVAFPEGKWYSLWDMSVVEGGSTKVVEAPTTFIPVYLRSGSVSVLTLPASLELGETMKDVETYTALLITPPEAERKNTLYTDTEKKTVFTSKNVSATTFTVTADKACDREIVLAYGVTAAEVSVDGEKLVRLTEKPDVNTYGYGYYVDPAGRTFIYAPAGWKTLTVAKGESRYISLALDTDNSAAKRTLLDEEIITVFAFNDTTQNELIMKLDGMQKVSRVDLRWTQGYAASYDVEYSTDGKIWTKVPVGTEGEHTVEGAIGGINLIDFEEVEAAYLRISNVEAGEDGRATLYAFAAYAMPQITEEYVPEEDEDWDEYLPDDDQGEGFITETDNEALDDESEETETVIVRKRKPNQTIKIITGMAWWAWLLIGGGVLLVAAGIVLLILLLKRKKKSAALEAVETPAEDLDFPQDI